MKPVGEIIEQLANTDVTISCKECGANITLVGKQYTVRCHYCGTNITLSPVYLARLKQLEYRAKNGGKDLVERAKCNICQDNGIITLREQVDDQIMPFIYRCICQAGQKRQEAWPVVPAAKVVAFVPRLRLVDADESA